MKKLTAVIFIVFFTSVYTLSQPSQEWIRNYNGPSNGNDEAAVHVTDVSGNVYAAGKFLGSGTMFDIYAVKYSSTGQVVWENTFNGPSNGNDAAYSVAVDNAGNLYVAGESRGVNTENDFILIKYDNGGAEQWSRRYNGTNNNMDIANAVAVDITGNAVITGRSWSAGELFDIVTIKYSSEGNVIWTRKFNAPDNGNDMPDDMAIDTDGNVYVTGSSFAAGTINDFITIKYSAAGNEEWTRRYNGSANGNDMFNSMTTDNSGNIIVTGSSVGSGTGLDFATVKYSPTGNVIWERRFTSQTVNIEEPKAISADNSGNIYITGTTTGYQTSYDFMTVKYSPEGEELWWRRYNGPTSNNFDEPASVATDNSGNVYVTGLSEGTGTMDDIVIIKYASNGDQVWINRYNSSSNRDDRPKHLSIDSYGNIIVSGFTTGLLTGADFSVMKYSQLTNLGSIQNESVSDYVLYQNYPNPFNPVTKVNYELRIKNYEFVSLKIFNAIGREVAVLVNQKQSSSGGTVNYEAEFDGTDLPSGVYYYSLTVNGKPVDTKKMILIK